MYAPKTLAAVLAVLASVASAAPAANTTAPITNFSLVNINTTHGGGCALEIETEFDGGCKGSVVVDAGPYCSEIGAYRAGESSVCNGTVNADFSKSPPKVEFVVWEEYVAYCFVGDGSKCTSK
jgi:hypothetical protein